MHADIERYADIFTHEIHQALNHALAPYNLNAANFFYLTILAQHPGINQHYFTKAINKEQSLVTKQINKLTKQGYIEKRTAKSDRRCSELYLTKKAELIIPTIKQISDEVSQKSIACLTPSEQTIFTQLLKKVAISYANPVLTDDPKH